MYVAAGYEYVKGAALSARSVRETCGNLQTFLFADSDSIATFRDGFDQVSVIDSPHRRSKLDYLGRSPFKYTLYLDADTRVLSDVSEIFQLLERFDLAAAHVPRRNHSQTRGVWRTPLPDSFPQLNGGVLLYKSTPAVGCFLERWRTAYHQAGIKKDQVTFRELLWESDLRLAVLPPEYNLKQKKYLTGHWEEWEAKPRILHMKEFVRKRTVRHPVPETSMLQFRRRLDLVSKACISLLVALKGPWI